MSNAMKYAMKCDRCGAYYDKDCFNGFSINLVRYGLVVESPDLCPNCEKELKIFLKGEN